MTHTLRPYQEQAITNIFQEWQDNNSTLLVMATGTGKTTVFSEVVKKIGGRALIIAHREELIWQAVKRVESYGMDATVEMADRSADFSLFLDSPVVVSTIQTQATGRMGRFNPDEFDLLVIDEAHHATADSYRRVIDYYRQNKNLKVLGVTATPDRADEAALGQVFESVAFDYEILDAINDGFLVPVEQQLVTIEGLDFSHIKTTCGDLNGADLAAVMEAEEMLHGVVSASLDIIGERRTLVFAVTVKQAEMYAEIFNRHRPDMADWVCGKTPKDRRHEILRGFSQGTTQVLVNVGVLTEGYDNPAVEVIVQARPTKSRCLYSQMIGRSTRPLPGIVDAYSTPAARKAAIAESSKPSCLVIDFVGNAGRHKLMTTADILGGKYSDEVVQRVLNRAKAKGKSLDMIEALKEEQRRLRLETEERMRREAANRAGIVGVAQFSAREIDPFDILQLEPVRERGWDKGKVISPKMAGLLRKNKIDPTKISYAQARAIIGKLVGRIEGNYCTLPMANLLGKFGYDAKEMSFENAKQLIDRIANNGWRRPAEAA